MSGIVNKVKEALHKDHSSTTHNANSNTASLTSGSTNHGPHDSNAANKVDPRVDSDRDGRAAHGHHAGGIGSNANSNTTSLTSGSTNHGPHDSNLANKADPRVDSDRDGRATHGHHSTTTGGFGSTTHGTTGHSATYGSTNNGPHDSNLANKVDPRVDSDLSSTGNRHGANTGGVFGASGSHATAGSGTAQNTSGPHNSDVLNKLDPRVDSDRDGSKTVGGNRTHA